MIRDVLTVTISTDSIFDWTPTDVEIAMRAIFGTNGTFFVRLASVTPTMTSSAKTEEKQVSDGEGGK